MPKPKGKPDGPRLGTLQALGGPSGLLSGPYSPYGVCAIIGRVFKSAQTAF
jgi:hypothetical protein